MRYREVHWTRLWRLLVVICLAMGLYSCSAKKVGSRPSQEPAMGSAESAQQAEAPPMDRKPMESAAAVGEATLEGSFQLQELRVLEGMAQTTLRIRFSQPVTQFNHFILDIPTRIVLDVFGDVKQMAKEENFHVGTGWVNDLKLITGKGYFRLVAQINAGSVPHFTADLDDNDLSVLIVVIGPINRKISTKKNLLLIQGGIRVVAARSASSAEASQAAAAGEVPSPQAVPEEKKYVDQRISLDFKDADIHNVFRILAEISDLNIVVTDDVKRKVTIHLEDVPADQVMDILLQTNGLAKEQVGNVVRISTQDRIRAERNSIRAAQEAKQSVESLETLYVEVSYAKVDQLETKIREVLTKRGTVSSDERTNILVIRDVKEGRDSASGLVTKLDKRTPQVLIESNIVETTPEFSRALGIDFNIAGNIHGDPTRTITADSNAQAQDPFSNALGLTFSVLQARWGSLRDVNAILTAAEKEGQVRIISRPSVVTLNNEKSKIESLRIVRIPITQPSTVNQTAPEAVAAGGAAVQDIRIGITLEVKPQISNDGFVLMEIFVKSSTLGSTTAGAELPDELTREATSKVMVRDGETVVIGGILKDTRSESEAGVPFLKEIPVIGWFFKRYSVAQDFEELMIFITPRILTEPNFAARAKRRGGAEDLPSAEQLWRNALKETEGDRPLIFPGPASP